MTIAEFFVKIGITGSDTARKELKTVGDSVAGISTAALGAYAAIAAMVLKLKSLADSALQTGTSLKQFATNTGMSMEMLQRYQWAASQSGVAADDFKQSIMNMQNKLMQMKEFGEGAFPGFSTFMAEVGASNEELGNTFLMVQKLQAFAQKMKSEPAKFTLYANNFGLSTGVAASMLDNQYTAAKLAKAKILKESDALKLDKVNIGLANIKQETFVEMAKVLGEFGPQLLPQVKELVLELIALGKAFAQLAKDTNFLHGLSKVMETMSSSIKQLLMLLNFGKALFGDKGAEEAAFTSLDKIRDRNTKEWSFINKDYFADSVEQNNLKDQIRNIRPPNPKIDPNSGPSKVNNLEINFLLNNDQDRPQAMLNDIQRTVENAFLNISSQTQAV